MHATNNSAPSIGVLVGYPYLAAAGHVRETAIALAPDWSEGVFVGVLFFISGLIGCLILLTRSVIR